MSEKQTNRSQLTHQELKSFVEQSPAFLWIALISIDGEKIGFYRQDSYAEEDRIVAMAATRAVVGSSGSEIEEDRIMAISAATTNLSERISSELDGGVWEFSIIAGKQAKIFDLMLNEESMLVAAVKPETSIDTTLIDLQTVCKRLLEIIVDTRL